MSTMVFPSACTIVEANAICESLVERIASAAQGSVSLDLSQVAQADVTLVQALLAFEKSATAKGLAFSVSPSPAVEEILAQAGLSGWPFAA